MAKTSRYAKFVKLVMKSDKVYMQRDENDLCYITDGYVGIRVPLFIYECEIRPLSGHFVELAPGEKATKDNCKGYVKPTERGYGVDVKKCLDSFAKDASVVKLTDFMYATRVNNKEQLVELHRVGDELCGVNCERLAAIKECAPVGETRQANNVSPLLWEDGDYVAFVMPVTVNSVAEKLKELVG